MSIFLTATAQAAAPACSHLFSQNKTQAKTLNYESAVELEIDATPNVMALLTTTDGTIGPVLARRSINILPLALQRTLKSYVGPNGNPATVPWEVLTPSEQKGLIMASAKFGDFDRKRTVPGLEFKETVTLNFKEPTRFLGQDYPAGTHQIKSSEIFASTHIEYMASHRMTKNLGFEFHIRSALSAGENLLTARALQTALIGVLQNMHIHMVGPTPKILEQQPTTTTLRMTDFIHRCTLYFDVLMIKRGMPMVEVAADQITLFKQTDPQDLANFAEAIQTNRPHLSKSGNVGLRTWHFYDKKYIWGQEVRFLHGKVDQKQLAQVLDHIQEKMINEDYFLSDDQAQFYANQHISTPQDLSATIKQMSYLNDFLDADIFAKITSEQADALKLKYHRNYFIGMLFHDWSRDPMYIDRPERLAQVQHAQKIAQQMLLTSNLNSTDVMQFFIKKSALEYDLNQMFQLRPNN